MQGLKPAVVLFVSLFNVITQSRAKIQIFASDISEEAIQKALANTTA